MPSSQPGLNAGTRDRKTTLHHGPAVFGHPSPDGNMIEVYVDVSEVWHDDPQRVADFEPLTL
jgi:hypothetical protein